MSKQSSIEWLVKEINDNIDFIPMSKWDEIREAVQQAKAMHKEEQRQTFEKAQECAVKHDGVYFNHTSFDEYYNETYKGGKQ